MLFLGKNANQQQIMRKKELNELLQGKSAVILIDDKIEGATYLAWQSLLPFQGELKELSAENEKKMLLSLIDKGFFDIKKVWRNSENTYIADGHQTIATLTKFRPEIESGQIKMLRKSDNEPTDLIPCIFINAEDEKDLSEKLLLINSEYGMITAQGLQSFKEKHGVSNEFLSNISAFKQWQPINPTWEQPVTTWDTPAPQTQDFGNSPNYTPIQLENPQEEQETPQPKRDLPSENYVEYPIMFKKEDYDFFVALVKRVKTEQLFEKNSEAIIHIARQYDTYVGSL